MRGFETIIAVLSVAAWIWLWLARGNFWSAPHQTHPGPPASGDFPLAGVEERGSRSFVSAGERIVAVVPARNEAKFIGASVKSLLAAGIRVVVVDDHSSDGTADIARATAAEAGKSGRLTVVMAKPLPAGWSGKLWAMHQGVQEALSVSGGHGAPPRLPPEFLMFTDADVAHTPETFSSLLEIAAGGRDIVSFMVKLHCRSLPEKLLIPAFVFFFFMLYPPAWVGEPRRKTAGAAGGCILIRSEALVRAGGLEAIRNEIIDDCALARAVKDSGGRLWLGLTESSASLRPYESLAGIGRMISRTAFNQLRHSTWLLLGMLFGLVVTYVATPVLLFTASGWTAAVAGLAWAAMTLAYLPMVNFYRLRPIWALSLPLAAAFYAGATVYSALLYWSGRGGRWKGRVQDAVRGVSEGKVHDPK
jgi:hopene-associated glycosyltransferase HpnB